MLIRIFFDLRNLMDKKPRVVRPISKRVTVGEEVRKQCLAIEALIALSPQMTIEQFDRVLNGIMWNIRHVGFCVIKNRERRVIPGSVVGKDN